jgi:hypothetical protein
VQSYLTLRDVVALSGTCNAVREAFRPGPVSRPEVLCGQPVQPHPTPVCKMLQCRIPVDFMRCNWCQERFGDDHTLALQVHFARAHWWLCKLCASWLDLFTSVPPHAGRNPLPSCWRSERNDQWNFGLINSFVIEPEHCWKILGLIELEPLKQLTADATAHVWGEYVMEDNWDLETFCKSVLKEVVTRVGLRHGLICRELLHSVDTTVFEWLASRLPGGLPILQGYSWAKCLPRAGTGGGVVLQGRGKSAFLEVLAKLRKVKKEPRTGGGTAARRGRASRPKPGESILMGRLN